jgi:hypothetical protein
VSAAAFYCVADERYFLGAVGLVNSLRLVGHTEPIYLLDCGLTAEQRELISGEVRVVDGPRGTPPWLLKTHAPIANAAEVAVLIDTDMVATGSLAPLIERAATGRVLAFRDRQQRYFENWGELLELPRPRRLPYVSSGLVFLGGEHGREVLELLDDRQHRVDFELTFWRRNVRDYELRYADQDVLNAVLGASSDAERFEPLDQRLAATPPFRGLRLADPGALACRYRDGTRPYVLHQYVRKPWLEATYDGLYSRLLRRLLTGADVPVRPAERDLPLRLRCGPRAALERLRINSADFLRWRLGDRLPGPLANWVEDRRRLRELPGQ